MNIRDALIGLSDKFGNANITLHFNDHETWTASIWADTRTILEVSHDKAECAIDALFEAIEQLEPEA